ncbi:MAG: hypothetical protein ACK449_10870 [Planctomycetota bacterium]|jgi:hypothetical protein
MTGSNSASRWLNRFLILASLAGGTLALGAIAPRFMTSNTKFKHLPHKAARGDLAVMVTASGRDWSKQGKIAEA